MAAHVLRGGELHPSHYVGAEIPILGSNAHWDPRGEYLRRGRRRERRHAAAFSPGARAHPQHRGGASRLSTGPRRDRGRVRKTAPPNQRHGFLLCGRSARRAPLRRASSGADFLRASASGRCYRATGLELHDFAATFCRATRRGKAGRGHPERAGQAQREQRARRHRARHRTRHSVRENRQVVRHFPARPPPLRDQVSERSFSPRRRLRASSDRDSRHPRDRALRWAQARPDDVSAASLFAHQGVADRSLARPLTTRIRLSSTDVYAASETSLPGVTGQTIADAISAHGHRGVSYQPRLDRLHCDMGRMLAAGDLVLSLGAGNVHEQLATLGGGTGHRGKAEGNRRRGRRRQAVRAARETYHPARRRAGAVLGRAAHRGSVCQTRSDSAGARICRSSSSGAARICSCAMVEFAASWCTRAAASSTGWKRPALEVTAGRGSETEGQIAYAGKAAGIGGFEWMEGIPGRGRWRVADERRRDGRADLRSGGAGALPRSRRDRAREDAGGDWKCITGTSPRSTKTLPSPRSSAGKNRRRRNRQATGGIAGETAHHATEREECRLHFQESSGLPGGQTRRRAGLERFAGGRCAGLRGARQLHRERRCRDRGRSVGVDRQDPGNGAPESAGSNSKPKCKSWGRQT